MSEESEGDLVAAYGIHSHPSDCNFRLQQFVGINGTKGARMLGGSKTAFGKGHFLLKIPMSEGKPAACS